MEIVINIDKKHYDRILKHYNTFPHDISSYERDIINGIILPEGHGDLIDRNDLLEYTDRTKCAYEPAISRYDIITASPIIKADEEKEEKEYDI